MKTPLLGNDQVPLSELFDDLGYYPHVVTNKRGSYTEAPDGYYFVATQGAIRKKHNLYGKPTATVLDIARRYCTDGSIGAFYIIPWKDKALVHASDRNMIAQPWIAFIPLDQVPDTTKIQERSAV